MNTPAVRERQWPPDGRVVFVDRDVDFPKELINMKCIRLRSWLAVLSLSVACSPLTFAQAADIRPAEPPTATSLPTPGHSLHGEVFDEGPRQAAVLMGNTGNVHFPVSSQKPAVQSFIDQGFGQLHGFWFFESERSFRQAAKLDPDCATAYMGMALSNLENLKRARGFISEAVKRKDKASAREKLFIEAFDAFLKEDPKAEKTKDSKLQGDEKTAKTSESENTEQDKEAEKKSREKLASDLENILHEHPEDMEAKALLGWHLWVSRSKGLPITSYFAVDALLHDVLEKNPMHPCHHYVIHLWDKEKPERALDSSAKCGQSALGIAHMWHMPGHIYSGLHRYHDAVFQQEASARVDYAHMMRTGVLPDQIHNFAHNNEWLIRNLIHVGNARAALEMAKNMLELPRHPKWNNLEKSDCSSGFGRSRLLETLAQFEDWGTLLKLADSPYLDDGGASEEQKIKRIQYLGLAAFNTGDFVRGCEYTTNLIRLRQVLETEQKAAQEKARSETAQAMKSSEDIDKAVKAIGKPFDGRISAMSVAIDDLEAQIHITHRAYSDAIKVLKQTTRVDRPLQARIHLAAGEPDKALALIREHVASHKNETIPLVHAVATLWQAGKKEEARVEFEKLRKLSEMIDLSAPVFRRLDPIAAEMKWPADWRLPVEPRTDTGIRPELAALGPYRWEPSPAPAWSLVDHESHTVSQESLLGKPVVVIFYLGAGCLHCVEQLGKFAPRYDDFAKLGIEVVGISTDPPTRLQQSYQNYSGMFPFRLLSNDDLSVFKSYRCFDDFEEQPLHGTFLISPGGRILWHDLGADPFMDVDFLLDEAKRALPLDESSSAARADQTTSIDK